MKRRVETSRPLDAVRTLQRLTTYGADPGMKIAGGVCYWAYRTEDGPVTLAYRQVAGSAVEVDAWGPGAERGLDEAPLHLGASDRPELFETDDVVIAPLVRRFCGFRFGRTDRIIDRLVPIIIGQKVTGAGAAQSWRDLVHRHGERAPEPSPKLWLMPSPERFSELAYYDLHPLGIERKRALVILEVMRRAKKIERLVEAGPDVAEQRLLAFRGIGPWTASIVRSGTFGDPDAVIVGDYNLPHLVTYAFTGERRGDDATMLELLDPFRGHRGRVVSLLTLGGHGPPRRGPRLPVRNIRDH